MTKIITRDQIEQILSIPAVLEAVEEGFKAYSRGESVVPPVALLHFDHPPGDCHIKYGYLKQGKYYIVKIASGFPQNTKNGFPAGNGMMLLFDLQNGKPLAILLDEGYLTDIRTAAAGCLAARYLAPRQVSCVGIVGTGAQAYHQLKLLSYATSCRRAMIWGRDSKKAEALKLHPQLQEWSLEVASDLDQLAAACNLIVTTTSSTAPLLFAHYIRPGTHITAVGADDFGKQELHPELFAMAGTVVVDSRSQCALFGDTSYALKEGRITPERLIELGEGALRQSETDITIADLTGIAIQDLQIASVVYENGTS